MDASDIIQTKFIKADVEDSISSLVGRFRKERLTEALAFKNKILQGVVRKRAFLRLRQDISSTKIKELVVKVPELTLSTPIEKIVSLMTSADVHILPVTKNNEIKGIVTAFDVLSALRKTFKSIKVFELLKEPPIILEEEMPISKAINFFKQKRIDHLPIVDKKGKLIGMVSIIDLITKYYLFPPKREQREGRRMPESHTWRQIDLSHLPIKNEISNLLFTANKDTPLIEIIDTFKEKQISSMIITGDKDVPIGIITIKDLLKLYPEL